MAVAACSKICIFWLLQKCCVNQVWICYRHISMQYIVHIDSWSIIGSHINKSERKNIFHNLSFFYARKYLSSSSNTFIIVYYCNTICIYKQMWYMYCEHMGMRNISTIFDNNYVSVYTLGKSNMLLLQQSHISIYQYIVAKLDKAHISRYNSFIF